MLMMVLVLLLASAILEDKTLKHGPLEILVTRDEETGLYGAAGLEAGVLKAKYMINVDSEEENAVCVGCAGGYTIHMKLATPRAPLNNEVQQDHCVEQLPWRSLWS